MEYKKYQRIGKMTVLTFHAPDIVRGRCECGRIFRVREEDLCDSTCCTNCSSTMGVIFTKSLSQKEHNMILKHRKN